MGRKLDDRDKSQFAPSAMLKEDGASLTGVLKAVRDVKTKFGPKKVYAFAAEDATCRFSRGQDIVEPKAGELVEVIPSTRLGRQLSQARIGDKLKIVYKGKQDFGGANPAHSYDVEVL